MQLIDNVFKFRFVVHRQFTNFNAVKSPNLILFDDPLIRGNLLPFTFSRPVADIRIGILSIREKWEQRLLPGKQGAHASSSLTESYLANKFPLQTATIHLLVNGSVLPDDNLLDEISALKPGECLIREKTLIAAVAENLKSDFSINDIIGKSKVKDYKSEFLQVKNLWDIFMLNEQALKSDYTFLTKGRKSQPLDKSNQLLGKNVFLEEGAKVSCSVLNSETGPIYIGKDAEVMEGSLIRGPFSLCEHSTLKMGAKIYGATTIGPHSKVGGEVNNSVIFGYSNKAHDGFLGNSVIGEWCNIGADSNNSNLKNNYASVKLWHEPSASFVDTGLQFCGLFMGDHSKCGINTMFNTGTVVGFSSNIFGAGFPRNFIPSFSWGGANGFSDYHINKAMDTADRVMQRRNLKLTDEDIVIWKSVYEATKAYRK